MQELQAKRDISIVDLVTQKELEIQELLVQRDQAIASLTQVGFK